MKSNQEEHNQDDKLAAVDRIAKLMDAQFTIPGTSITFGLDPIMDIIPGAGAIITFVVSMLLVLTMRKFGASGNLIVKMILNVIFDTLLGAIPFIGPVADIFYRANVRNVRMLKEHYGENQHQGSGAGILLMIVGVILFVLIGLIYSFFKLLSFLF